MNSQLLTRRRFSLTVTSALPGFALSAGARAALSAPGSEEVSRAEEGSQGRAAHGSRHWGDHRALVEHYLPVDLKSRLQAPGEAAA